MDDPEFLYKYRSLNTAEELDRVRSILTEHRVWFSNADAFNDPYDCYPVVRTQLTKEGMEGVARRVAERRARGGTEEEKKRALRETLEIVSRNRLTSEEVQAESVKLMNHLRDTIGIYSLSSSPDNVLLWSHYGCSHTGVCLRFRMEVASFVREAIHVRYSKERPTIDFITDRTNTMERMLLHKADYWAYEDEWRIVKTGKVGFHTFPAAALDGIIFGSKIDPDVEASIREAALAGGVGQNLFRTVFDDETFRLNIVPA